MFASLSLSLSLSPSRGIFLPPRPPLPDNSLPYIRAVPAADPAPPSQPAQLVCPRGHALVRFTHAGHAPARCCVQCLTPFLPGHTVWGCHAYIDATPDAPAVACTHDECGACVAARAAHDTLASAASPDSKTAAQTGARRRATASDKQLKDKEAEPVSAPPPARQGPAAAAGSGAGPRVEPPRSLGLETLRSEMQVPQGSGAARGCGRSTAWGAACAQGSKAGREG
jgi:hypothetical protein